MNFKYKILTVSSHRPKEPYYCYDGFFESLRRHGVEPVLLGPKDNKFAGLGAKPWPVLNYLLHGGAAGCDYVIFSDCWDVLFSDHPDEVIRKFLEWELPCDIVVNGENNCFPLPELKDQFDQINHPPDPYRYLNSGFYVGAVDAVISMLEQAGFANPKQDFKNPNGTWTHFEDQSPIQKVFLSQFDRGLCLKWGIALDTRAEICNTLGGAEMSHFDFSGERIRNTLTGTYPSVWHANGGGKTTAVFQEIRRRMNL